MTNLIAQVSKYLIIILMALYTLQCYTVFRKKSEEARDRLFFRQNLLMFFMHFVAFAVIYLEMGELEVLFFYGAQVLYLAVVLILFHNLYPLASRLLINNMCMLICIGFIMITRLDYDQCVKQFQIAVVSTVVALLVPVIIRKLRFITKMYWIYTLLGIGMLALVAIAAQSVNGAKLSFTVGGLSIQPSEFVKIIFVFAIAGLLTHARDFRRIAMATILAAVHVLILVVSKDLGSAVIFFMTYLVMLFIATRNPFYSLVGMLAGSVGAVGAYFLFSHIRVRVQAWLDPFADYQVGGYQIAQSLFSIAAGGWFGTGLFQGSPTAIPYVEQDMMFSAIAEELGSIFGICLILVCMSCFIMFINIGMQLSNRYYRLVAVGLGTTYAVQVILTIGGGIKFLPLTGVTLPLVSYGGSSMLSTLIMFAIVQGLYMLRSDEAYHKEQKEAQQNLPPQGGGGYRGPGVPYGPNGYPQGPSPYGSNGYLPNGSTYRPNGYPQNGGGYRNGGPYAPGGRPQGEGVYGPNGRPQGKGVYGPNGRPQGEGAYGPNGRPQGGGSYGPNVCPQGGGSYGLNVRPQGGGPYGPNVRPQGGGPYGSGSRPQGDESNVRPQGEVSYGPDVRSQGGSSYGPNARPNGGGSYGSNVRPQGNESNVSKGHPNGGGSYTTNNHTQNGEAIDQNV